MKIQKNFDKEVKVFDSEATKYKKFFDSAPIALWIEDFSKAKTYLEDIAKNNNTTPKKYLKKNPEIIYQLAPLVEVVDANQTAVTMHKAKSKKELLTNLHNVFTQESNFAFSELLLAFFMGENNVEAETINTTLEGEEFNISLKFNIIDETTEQTNLIIVSVENITDKVKVREALFESEKQYKEAQKLAKIGSWYYDFGTKKITWSNETYLILDLDPSKEYDLTLDFYLSFVHPEDKNKVQEFSFDYLLNNRHQYLQYRIVSERNELKYIQEKRSVIIEDNKVKKIIGIAQDITESVVAKKKLDSTKKILFDTLTGINDGLVILDKNDEFIHVNKRAEHILGVQATNLLGNSIWTLFKDVENDPFAKCYTKAKQTKEPQTEEDYLEYWEKWFETRMIPSKEGVLIFFQETTEKRKTENKIKTAYNIINKSSAVAFLCKNAYDFPIEFASENTVDLFEYPYTDFLENKIKIFDIVHPDDLPYVRENIFKLLKEDDFEDFDTKPFRVITKTNKIRWIEVTFEIIRNSKKEITHLQGIATDVTERKQEQELLFKNTQHLVDQFNNTPMGSVIWGMDFRVVDWNKSAERIFGYTKEEAIGKHVKEIIIPEDYRDEIDNVWESILSFSGGHTNTNQNVTKDGRTIICDWYNVTLKDTEGNVTGVASLCEDITDKILAKRRLEKSEKKYKDIFEKSTDSVFILKNNYIIDCNQSALSLFGYTNKSEITNILPSEISPTKQPNGELSVDLAKKQIQKAFAKGSNRFEWYHKKKNGNIIPCEVSLTYIEDVEGEPTIHAVVRDISRRVREEQLKEVLFNISNASLKSENFQEYGGFVKNQLNYIIDTTNFFIALLDSEEGMLKTAYISDKYESLATFPIDGSYTGYVIRSKKPLLINNNNYKQLIDEGKVKMIGQPSKSWMGVPLSFNDRIFGAIVIQSYTDENAYTENDLKLLEFVADQISISIYRKNVENELKEALEKAQESDRLKSAFLANMSHEIRTPMNGIIGFSELLTQPNITNEQRTEYANIVIDRSKQLLTIVNDVLDISKIEAGVVKLNNEPVNINKIIDDLHAFYAPKAKKNKLDFVTEKGLNDTKSTISIDKTKLNQVLTNLLSNAFKFTHQGSIHFGYQVQNNGYLKFFVTDTGVGIEKNLQKKIFDRFIQAELELNKLHTGTGLGLAISKKFVELFGGSIWLNSSPKGTTVNFTIPFSNYNTEEEIHTEVKEPTTQGGYKKNKQATILVAEDEEYNLLYINELFATTNYKVITAENGKIAIDKVAEHPEVDIVLMDIKMPVMNGKEAAKIIKSEYPKLPVIALTAFAMDSDIEKSIKTGFDGFLTKPIDKEKLFNTIEKHTNN